MLTKISFTRIAKPAGCFGLLLILFCLGCSKKTTTPEVVPVTHFGNVVILGNSITFSPANPQEGWSGNWGMAASSAEQDYVHLLTGRFRQYNDTCHVQALNIAAFEVGYASYDLDANLKKYRDSKPELLILRIGENVPDGFDVTLFSQKYKAIIDYMKTNNPNLKVLAVGSFFIGKEAVDRVMGQYSQFISLSFLASEGKNLATYLVNAPDGVKQHPGDVGMQKISDTIWAQVATL